MKSKIIIIISIVAIVIAGVYFFSPDTEIEKEVKKINLDVACEESLIYKTFPDGESADKFVEECKEGKHPEVLTEYIERMNLGNETES